MTGCVHGLIEAQARMSPHSTAVVHNGSSLSYGALNGRANRLARHLAAQGVGQESLVTICIERSFEMIVAMLATLKAGAAFVPLDPLYPDERLDYLMKDTRPAALLTTNRLAERFRQIDANLFRMDADWHLVDKRSETDPSFEVRPENLAYVIYTSGSTGRPRGVMVERRSMLNFIEAVSRAYDIASHDRVLQFASLSFDTSVEEIFPCLSAGATLVLRSDSMPSSASLFADECRSAGITLLDLPTAFWHEITRLLTPSQWAVVSRLRAVIIGGESALPEQLARWRSSVKGEVKLFNTYGPTEATVVTTMRELSSYEDGSSPLPDAPIGQPIANAEVFLFDQNLQPVPSLSCGEMGISGAGLSRGYLNHPDRTAERFIPNPFASEPGMRLYRTGDVAMRRDDGDLIFAGRIDHQVKIRGFRVELGEIETCLADHPEVYQAVVIAKETPNHDKHLIAYVILNKEATASAGLLGEYLGRRLPDYMVPSFLEVLDRFPVTVNGKVDRQELAALDNSERLDRRAGTEPEGLLESQILKMTDDIFSEL